MKNVLLAKEKIEGSQTEVSETDILYFDILIPDTAIIEGFPGGSAMKNLPAI